MIWPKDESVAFCKTRERWGEFSNMCAGFPITTEDGTFRTSEALYQSRRFPDHPSVRTLIREAASPMVAKMIAKRHIHLTREDWMQERVNVMRECLEMKLSQNHEKFSFILKASGDKHIVELSWKDQFWGAKPRAYHYEGKNQLGQLLMELRDGNDRR